MSTITVFMLTLNEENNIADCINSFKHIADRIVIWDGCSSDNTVEIAKSLGAEVYQNDATYKPRFYYGIHNSNIDTDWVAFIEADERFTTAAADELKMLCDKYADTDTNGIVLRDKVCFMGRELYHGGIYPFQRLRVWKPGLGEMEDVELDEHIILSEGKIAYMKNDIMHTDYNGLYKWSVKHCEYAIRASRDAYKRMNGLEEYAMEGLPKSARIKRFLKYKVYYKLPMGMRAHLLYIYTYYIRLGFLDGKEGKIYAFLHSYWYRFLVDAFIYENYELPKKIKDK